MTKDIKQQWSVKVTVTVPAYITVEAQDKPEALREAQKLVHAANAGIESIGKYFEDMVLEQIENSGFDSDNWYINEPDEDIVPVEQNWYILTMVEKKINKGRFKEEWMHLRSRPAGPIPRKTQMVEEEIEEEEFLPSEEPFFFEEDKDE